MFQWLTGNAINFFESSQWSTQFTITFIIASLILFFVNPLLLWLATRTVKIKNNYKKAFITNLLFYVAIFITGIIVDLIIKNPKLSTYTTWVLANFLFVFWLIKKRYKLDWKKGLLVWLMWTFFTTSLGWIVGFIYLFIAGMIIDLIALILSALVK